MSELLALASIRRWGLVEINRCSNSGCSSILIWNRVARSSGAFFVHSVVVTISEPAYSISNDSVHLLVSAANRVA